MLERSRSLLILLVGLGAVTCDSPRETVTQRDARTGLKEEYQVVRDPSSNKPTKHGFWHKYYRDGTYMEVGRFENGLRVGEWIWYYEDGQIATRGSFANDDSLGVWTWNHPNGMIAIRGVFAGGLRSGEWSLHDEGGDTFAAGIYDQGTMRDGTFFWIDTDAGVRVFATLKNGSRHGSYSETPISSGNSESGEYDHGRRRGEWTVSSSEGKTLLTSHYDESGSVAATTRWSYVSDVLRDAKTFRGTTGPHFGVLHGTSTVYHSSGKIERQTEYRDGKKHGPDVEYHSNGQIRFEATYFAGKLHGPWTRYWENGALDSRGHYKAGKKHGTFDYYLSDGSLRDRDVYEEGRCSRECEGTE